MKRPRLNRTENNKEDTAEECAQIPNFSEISQGFGSYEHLKFRPICRLKYRLWRHNHVIVVTSQIFCYYCIEYIKLDTCAKFHDHRSNNHKVMMPMTDSSKKAHVK